MYTIRPANWESAKFPQPACGRGGPQRRRLQCLFNLLSSRAPPGRQPLFKVCFHVRCQPTPALWLPLLAASAAWAARTGQHCCSHDEAQQEVTIKLHPDWAPKHVAQIKTLVKRSFTMD